MNRAAVFHFGDVAIDPVAYASQGNAVLGIRDSGKTYTATALAECLYEAGIPFVAFDPIGVWRFLRVPRDAAGGRGYPIVVAGGAEGDLPLTPETAPGIVEAAMRAGVSLVLDLFDISLSKSDWRAIVRDSVKALLHGNRGFGLRHVFLEEAAEFVPQRPQDIFVYAEVEKLARMGGNSRLGYTLINQRSQEVAKAVLELCDNVFLHRQRGKNALENLDKWLLAAGEAERRAIMASLPDLPQGDCWAWLGGDDPQPPKLIHVPAKRSLHPDRRLLVGEAAHRPLPPAERADIDRFVTKLKLELHAAEAPIAAPAPAKSKPRSEPDAAVLEAAERRGYERGAARGLERGFRAGYVSGFEAARKLGISTLAGASPEPTPADVEANWRALAREWGVEANAVRVNPVVGAELRRDTKGAVDLVPAPASQPKPPAATATDAPAPARLGERQISGAQSRVLQALAWWRQLGHESVTRPQLAGVTGHRVTSGHFNRLVGELSTAGLVEYPRQGVVRLTAAGAEAAPRPDMSETLIGSVRRSLSGAQRKVFDALLDAGDEGLARAALAGAVGLSEASGHFARLVGQLSTLQLVEYPDRGHVALQAWVAERADA